MLQRLYQRVLALSASPRAPWWLAFISFVEASCFPIPPDVLLVPMALARPDRAWRLALICTIASVAGGALGYFIGYALFNVVAAPLLHAYHYDAAFKAFQDTFAKYGVAIILVKGLTPIPYKIVTIASGFAGYNFVAFVLLSLLTRGVRFFAEAFLLKRYGPRARVMIEKRLGFWVTIGGLFLIGGIVAALYLL